MESKKPLNSLTEEELTRILEQTSVEDKNKIKIEEASTNDILEFISFYNLQAGTNVIPAKLIKRLYSHWSKNPVYAVNAVLTEFFPTYLAHTGKIAFLLNQDAMNISKELFNFLDKPEIKNNKSYRKHCELFLKKFDLKSGNFEVCKEVIYYLYDKWMYSKRSKEQLSLKNLSSILKVYLKFIAPHGRTIRGKFSISKSVLKHITLEEINQIEKGTLFNKNAKEKIIKKKNKQKKSS